MDHKKETDNYKKNPYMDTHNKLTMDTHNKLTAERFPVNDEHIEPIVIKANNTKTVTRQINQQNARFTKLFTKLFHEVTRKPPGTPASKEILEN